MTQKESSRRRNKIPILLSTLMSVALLSPNIVQAENVENDSLPEDAEVDASAQKNEEDQAAVLDNSSDGNPLVASKNEEKSVYDEEDAITDESNELQENESMEPSANAEEEILILEKEKIEGQAQKGALMLISAQPTADELYDSTINAQFAYEAWDNALLFKELYPSDKRVQNAIDTAAGYILNQGIKSHENGDYSKAVAIYGKIISEKSVSDAIYHPANVYYNQALNQQKLITADDLYDSIIHAKYAYEAWDRAQLFREMYSTDSRVQTAVDTAAGYVLNQAINSHRNSDFAKAIETYGKILSNNTVSASIYNPTNVYYNQALNQQELTTAEDLYDSIIHAQYAYEAWENAQLFKELYPQHSKVQEALDIAAEYNLRQGVLSYERGNFEKAIEVFNKLINEPLVNGSTSQKAQEYKAASTEHIQIQQANDLYDSIMNAQYAYEAWDEAQLFKELYPNDARLQELLDTAAGYNLRQGIKSHRANDFDKAIEVYTKLLSEPLLNSGVSNQTAVLSDLAENGITPQSADELHHSVMNARYAYEAWDEAQLFKKLYPTDERVQEVLDTAAGYNLRQGIISHRANDFNKAIEVYTKLLSESSLNSGISNQAGVLSGLAENGITPHSADELHHSVMNARYAYEAWDDAQMFKALYPNDMRLQEVLDTAAGYNLRQGIISHRANNFDKAIEVYTKLLSENLLDSSILAQAEGLSTLAENAITPSSADELHHSVMNARYAYEAWDDAQMFKLLYPNDVRLQEVLNTAAGYNLRQGIISHQKNDFEKAQEVYSKLLAENALSPSLFNTAEMLAAQAQNSRKLRTADELYDSIRNAEYAYQAWDDAQYFKSVYPNDTRVSSAINIAAEYQFNQGISSHRNSNFSNAIMIYERLLNEEFVDTSLKTTLQFLYDQAKNNQKLSTKNEYYNKINTTSVSASFDAAVEGNIIYPKDSKMTSLLNQAANDYLREGRNHQRNGRNSQASLIYSKIMNETTISQSIRTLAEVFNNQLNEQHVPVVYLDPGHGASDPGAVHGGIQEKRLNLTTSNYLKSALEAKGYLVIMSRETDHFVGLADRAFEANELKADIFVSVHYNSMGGSGIARGIETFIHHTVPGGFGQETRRSRFKTDNPRISESLYLADDIHNELIRKTGMYNRGVKGNNYSVLRNTQIPAVLLELGFMDNAAERARISTYSYQKTAAYAIADGIDKYFRAID